ncbi:hypothetical protein [Aquirufa sp. Wall-65K1]
MDSKEPQNTKDDSPKPIGLKILGLIELNPESRELLDKRDKMEKEEALEAGFDDVGEYLDFNEFKEDEESRARLKMTRESYLRWKYMSQEEIRIYEEEQLARIKNIIESSREKIPTAFRKRHINSYDDIDEESIIMRDISNGNGDLHGF